MSRPRTATRRLFDGVSTGFFLAFRAAARALPASLARDLGRLLGAAWFVADPARRRLGRRNIHAALGGERPPGALDRILFLSFLHLGQVVVELARHEGLAADTWRDFLVFEGEEHARLALDRGEGLIGISAHLGNWEFLSGHCFLFGRAHIVARRIHNPGIDRLVRGRREAAGLVQIDPTGSTRPILRALAANEPVCFLLDQSASSSQGVVVDFFGRPASTFAGPAVMALRTGAPVTVLTAVRREDGRVRIAYSELLTVIRTGDFQEEVRLNTQLFTLKLEEIIRRHPDQWFWVHDRWRVRRSSRG